MGQFDIPGGVDRSTSAARFNTVAIMDTGGDHSYTFQASGNEGANRTITVPLVSGNRTLAFTDHAQTFTVDQTFSGWVTVSSGNLRVKDTGGDHAISFAAGADEAANRTLTIPPLGGNDTLMTLATTQTITGRKNFHAGASTIVFATYWTGDTSNPTLEIRNDANVAGEMIVRLYTGTSKCWLGGLAGLRFSSDLGFGIVNNTNAYGNVNSVQLGLAAAGVWDVTNEGAADGTSFRFKPLSPAQITADQTNYSAFIGGSKVVRVSTDALRELQGIAAGTSGVEHVLILTGSNNLTVKHDSGSATGKRIYCHGSADITLAPNDILFLWFDATTDVWRAR